MNKVWMLYITFGVCGFPLGDFVCVLSIYSILHDSLCFPAKLKKGSSKSMTNWCRKAVLRCLAKLVDQRVIWDNVTLWSWWWVWYTNADIFNLMALSHYSITPNSMDFVSAMQLEMTIRKISIKDTLGRSCCTWKITGTSVTVLFLASRAELSCGPGRSKHKGCSAACSEGSSLWWQGHG